MYRGVYTTHKKRTVQWFGVLEFQNLGYFVDPWFWGKKLSLVHWNGTGVAKDTIKENATATTAGDRPKGRVVGILKRNWREYCGSLRPLQAERQRESGPGVYNKSDRVFIPTESWHFDGWRMVKSVEECGNTYTILNITIHWHKPCPNFCRFIVGLTRFSICPGSWGIANFDPDPDLGIGGFCGRMWWCEWIASCRMFTDDADDFEGQKT